MNPIHFFRDCLQGAIIQCSGRVRDCCGSSAAKGSRISIVVRGVEGWKTGLDSGGVPLFDDSLTSRLALLVFRLLLLGHFLCHGNAKASFLTVYTERRWAIDGVMFIHRTFTFKLTQSNQDWGRYTRCFTGRALAARAAMPPAPPPTAHKVPSRKDRSLTLHECLLAVLNKTLSSEQNASLDFQSGVGTDRF